MEGKQNNYRPRLMSDIQRPASKPRVQTQPVKRVEPIKPVMPAEEEKDIESIPMRAILGAWSRQAVRGTPMEKHLKYVHHKGKHLVKLKNQATSDLKWALMADLDEPVRHRSQQQNTIAPKRVPDVKKPHAAHKNTGKLRNFVGRLSLAKWISIIVFIAAVVVLLLYIPKLSPQLSVGGTSSHTDTVASASNPVLPKGKSTSDITNYQQVHSNTGQMTYGYTDEYQGTPISVTETKATEIDQSSLDAKVAKMAQGYAQVTEVVAGGTKAYVSSPPNSTQSIIFAKNGWIITIGSPKNLSAAEWQTYISGMQ